MLSAVITVLRLREERDLCIREHGKGRPLVKVEEGQLRFLVESSFTISESLHILGCTVHFRILAKFSCT